MDNRKSIELPVSGKVSAWLSGYNFWNRTGIMNGRIKNIAYSEKAVFSHESLACPFRPKTTGQTARVDITAESRYYFLAEKEDCREN